MAGDAKAQLLERVLDFVRTNGLGDASLRELAASVGTSHRMLIYHFGSREGLVAELVNATERREREALRQSVLELGDEATPAELLRRSWKRISDPAVASHERLFFELYAQGLVGREPAASIIGDLVQDWIRAVRPESRDLTRLSLAVTRGLLLDLLATGDRRAADRAFEMFVGLLEAGETIVVTGVATSNSNSNSNSKVSGRRVSSRSQ